MSKPLTYFGILPSIFLPSMYRNPRDKKGGIKTVNPLPLRKQHQHSTHGEAVALLLQCFRRSRKLIPTSVNSRVLRWRGWIVGFGICLSLFLYLQNTTAFFPLPFPQQRFSNKDTCAFIFSGNIFANIVLHFNLKPTFIYTVIVSIFTQESPTNQTNEGRSFYVKALHRKCVSLMVNLKLTWII